MAKNKYVKIPIEIVLDNNITINSKLLYGILLLLTHKNGYCFANNNYLAKYINVSSRTITRLLKELDDNGYIKMEFKHKFQRKIYIIKEFKTSINLDDYVY